MESNTGKFQVNKYTGRQFLHGLKLYEHKRNAIFRVDINQYDAKVGWLTENETISIIGEDDYNYVYKLVETNSFMESPDRKPITGDLLYGRGIHKDYFVKWVETQLELF